MSWFGSNLAKLASGYCSRTVLLEHCWSCADFFCVHAQLHDPEEPADVQYIRRVACDARGKPCRGCHQSFGGTHAWSRTRCQVLLEHVALHFSRASMSTDGGCADVTTIGDVFTRIQLR